jgi:hypothetical protein
MTPFRFLPAVFLLVLALAGQPAGAAQVPQSPGDDTSGGFLLFDAPEQKNEARALLDAFLAKSCANFRDGGGIPGSADFQSIFFEQDDESHRLDNWPGMELRYSGGELFLKDETGERRIAAVRPLNAMLSDWPLADVDVADIDFDGQPDFFVLTMPAAVGSFLSHLLYWDRKNSRGQPLFAPIPADRLPPSAEAQKVMSAGKLFLLFPGTKNISRETLRWSPIVGQVAAVSKLAFSLLWESKKAAKTTIDRKYFQS